MFIVVTLIIATFNQLFGHNSACINQNWTETWGSESQETPGHFKQPRGLNTSSIGNVSDKPSQYVDTILFILILMNVTAVCLESVKDIGEAYKDIFYNING